MHKTPSALNAYIGNACTKVAKALHDARVERNLSMTRVAEKAGLSRQIVSYTERELRKPTLDTILRLGYALGVDVGKLISEAAKEE